MVQVLEGNRYYKPTAGQRLSAGIQPNLQVGREYVEKQEGKQRLTQENEALKKMGIDLSGVADPAARKEIVSKLLERQNKESLMGKKQEFLSNLLGGGSSSKGGMNDNLFAGQSKNSSNRMSAQNSMNGENLNQNSSPLNITDLQILQASSIDPVLGRELRAAKDTALEQQRHRENVQEKHNLLTRKEETEISKPILLSLNESRKNIPLQEQAIEDIISTSSEVGARDYLADITGFEPLRTESGAKLKTAIKDFFLSDLTRVGARPNQWIEKQLNDALPKIGRSVEANHIVAEGMKFKVELAKKRIEIIDKMAEEDREKFGYVKGNIDVRATEKMKPFVEQKQKEMRENIERIKKNNLLKGKPEPKTIDVIGPDGQIYEINFNEVDQLPEGYRVQ